MPFNPEKRAEYDKARYRRVKAEFMEQNPNYIPRAERRRQKREQTINRYGKNTDANDDIDNPFTTLFLEQEKNKPKPKPVFNKNGLEAKKADEIYADENEAVNDYTPKFIFAGQSFAPLKRNNITFY